MQSTLLLAVAVAVPHTNRLTSPPRSLPARSCPVVESNGRRADCLAAPFASQPFIRCWRRACVSAYRRAQCSTLTVRRLAAVFVGCCCCRVSTVRVRGGNLKFRALRLESGNFAWGTEGTHSYTRRCPRNTTADCATAYSLLTRALYRCDCPASAVQPSPARLASWTWCTTRPTTSWCAPRLW